MTKFYSIKIDLGGGDIIGLDYNLYNIEEANEKLKSLKGVKAFKVLECVYPVETLFAR